MKSDACDLSRLDAFLLGEMTIKNEEELTRHLDTCSSCGSELEKRAANAERWNEIKSLLVEPPRSFSESRQSSTSKTSLPLPIRQVLEMLAPTDDPSSLGRIDSFEILGVIGSGGMGVVLKAADRPLDRIVALKVMNPSLAVCGTARQRFAREAKAAAGILHPNVIAIHSVSTTHVLPYLVMPYVKGISLQHRVDKEGPLSRHEILRIGSQLAAGLVAAHQQGLIHRDIKPSNVMLDEGVETAMITDFGLARTIDDATMTRSGAITGTPEYMSPEQARGESIDCSSDIFSLGSVLYTLCTGHPPFRAQTAFGVLRRITDQQPTPIRDVNPEIPLWLVRIVKKLHAKDANARPTAEQAHALLERCLAHVYQPDRIQLPAELTRSSNQHLGSFSRILKIGAITMTSFSVLLLLAYAIVPPATQSNPLTENQTDQPMPLMTSGEPTVFKTLNLDFPKSDEPGLLVIDINRGFVEVTGHDQPGVIIEILNPQQKTSGESDEAEFKQQFAPQFDLDMNKAKNKIKLDTYNQDYALNLRIKVPTQTDLSLDTYYDGYLQVKDVSGTIITRSQNCDIRLLEISGTAKAFSYNGDFTVSFKKLAENAKLDFESYNGSIDLTLPINTAATTAITTGTGSYRSMFDIQPLTETSDSNIKSSFDLDRESSYQFGNINGGGIPIRMESKKGKISLRKRAAAK